MKLVTDVLRARQAATRVAGAKLAAVAELIDGCGRVRDLFVYHGAHTGRWTSRRVQVHNLPRGAVGIDVPRLLAEPLTWERVVAEAGRATCTPDDALSALLRPCIVPADGHVFVICDYVAAECRGIAWLAGETTLLHQFAEGRDVYCEMASRIFGRAVTKADRAERQVGKIVVLGSGYQMSADKLGAFCANSGVDLDAAGTTAGACIEAYRNAFPRIAGVVSGNWNGRPVRRGGVWGDVGAAFRSVTSGDASVLWVARCGFHSSEGNTEITLPSGRVLTYRNARMEDRVPSWGGDPRPAIVFTGPRGDAATYGGKLCENLTQAVCRDLLADALVRCESAGLPVVLHCHDELVCEVPADVASPAVKKLHEIMSSPPEWAAGFPLQCEAYASPRYTKSHWPGYPAKG